MLTTDSSRSRTHRLISLWPIALGLSLCLAACNSLPPSQDTPSADPFSTVNPIPVSTPPGPNVSPFIDVTVTGVDVHFLDSQPVQVELVIHGSLPDQCTYDFHVLEKRTGQQVKVMLISRHPADTSCAQTPQPIAYTLPLGSGYSEDQRGFEPGDYQLLVNRYQTSFSITP